MLRMTKTLAFGALAVLAIACGERSMTGPEALPQVASAPAPALRGGVVSDLLRRVSCIVPDTVALTVGSAGGTLTLGGNRLVIPPNALKSPVRILMMPLLDGTAGVRFLPHGLLFSAKAKPTLTLSTACVGNPPSSYIVYTDDFGRVLERFKPTARTATTISTPISHFSRYAVAW